MHCHPKHTIPPQAYSQIQIPKFFIYKNYVYIGTVLLSLTIYQFLRWVPISKEYSNATSWMRLRG